MTTTAKNRLPLVIGIDPGTGSTGLALLDPELTGRGPGGLYLDLVASRTIKQRGGFHAKAAMDNILRMASLHVGSDNREIVVAMEDQYAMKGPRFNAKTFKIACRTAGGWQAIVESLGFNVNFVDPKTWQAAILSVSGHSTRDETKAASSALVLAMYGPAAGRSVDECDAICIARYWADELRIQGRLLTASK